MSTKFVTVLKTEFVKNNTPILFRGINIGSWLSIEHYMVGIPTPDNQIRLAVQDVFGPVVAEHFFDSFIKNFITEKDFQFLKECGVNIVRVPFNYRLFIDDNAPDTYKESGFRYFDYLLDLCEKYEIYLLPDLHAAPGGQNPDWHCDNDTGIPQFWLYKVFRDQIVALWKAIARHCSDREYLLGYDLLNEPYLINAPDVLADFYKEVTDAIRSVDPNHIIFLEGDYFAMKFDCIHHIFDSNTALTFHYYPTVWEPELFSANYDRQSRYQKFKEILLNISSIRNKFQRPILCGEAGYDIDPGHIMHTIELLEDTLELFNSYSISWTLWCYKDARFMGLCYPVKDSPWMQLVDKVHQSWTHYREMGHADSLMEAICEIPEFGGATSELKYYMQFRQRGILYRFQAECILVPLLKQYTADELLALPGSFLFENCNYYVEYAALLKRRTSS